MLRKRRCYGLHPGALRRGPYVLFWVLWAFALTFASGSVDAWLYEVLERYFDTDEFVRIRGRGESVMQWTSVITMIGGGTLYALNPIYPFVASVILNSLGLLVLFTFPAGRIATEDTPSKSDRITILDALPLIRQRFASQPLRSFVVYAGLFFAIISAADSYIQPVARELFQATLESVSIADQSLPLGVVLGFLYAGFTVISAIGSYFANDIKATLGLWWTLLIVPIVTAVLLVLPRIAVVATMPMFVAIRGSKALLLPIVNGHLNYHVGSAGRATTLSAFSMLYQLLRIPLVLIAGVVADVVNETAAVAVLGGVFLFGAAITWVVGSPVERVTTT